MAKDSRSLTDSYAAARDVCRRSGSSFHFSFRLLPTAQRRGMEVLYAFARATDDLGDTGPQRNRRENLQRWRAAVETTMAGGDVGEPQELPIAILPALREQTERFQIPPRYLFEIIDGVALDQNEVRIESIAQLQEYCYLVAGTVGLCCTYIWGRSELPQSDIARLDRAAIRCGYAFQLTNILRDLREDAAMGRTYLPRQLCDEYGLCEPKLSTSFFGPSAASDRWPYADLVRRLADEALAAYQDGWFVHEAIEPAGRRMFSLMWRGYRELLLNIRQHPRAAFSTRARLSIAQRARLVATHFVPVLYSHLAPPPKARFNF